MTASSRRTVRCRTWLRRLVVTGLAMVGALLVATPALADNCSSPSDCANTAWTVAAGAVAAGTVIAAGVAAGGALDPNAPEVDPDDLPPGCEDMPALRREILGLQREVSGNAVRLKGANKSLVDAEAGVSAADSAIAHLRVYLGYLSEQGEGATVSSTTATTAGMGAARIEQVARSGAAKAAAQAAGAALAAIDISATLVGVSVELDRRGALYALGQAEAKRARFAADVPRWQAEVDQRRAEVDDVFARMRPVVAEYEQVRTASQCPYPPLDVDALVTEVDRFTAAPIPQGVEAGLLPAGAIPTAPTREQVLEDTGDADARDRECDEYDRIAADYEQAVAEAERAREHEPDLERWVGRYEGLVLLHQALQSVEQYLQSDIRDGTERYRDVTTLGFWASLASAGTAALGILAGATFPIGVAVALGLTSIGSSVVAGTLTPQDAAFHLLGRVHADLAFVANSANDARVEYERLGRLVFAPRQRAELLRSQLMALRSRCQYVWRGDGEPVPPTPEVPPWQQDGRPGYPSAYRPADNPFMQRVHDMWGAGDVQAVADKYRAVMQEVNAWG